MRTCETCKHFDHPRMLSPSGRRQPNKPVKCLWKSVEPWPIAVGNSNSRPHVGHVSGNRDATNCQCFTDAKGDK